MGSGQNQTLVDRAQRQLLDRDGAIAVRDHFAAVRPIRPTNSFVGTDSEGLKSTGRYVREDGQRLREPTL